MCLVAFAQDHSEQQHDEEASNPALAALLEQTANQFEVQSGSAEENDMDGAESRYGYSWRRKGRKWHG